MKSNKIIGLSAIALLALAPFMEAGKISPLGPQALPSHSTGFGAWDLGNVNVKMTDLDYNTSGLTLFDESTGSYDSSMGLGDTFESDIHDTITANTGTVLVNLHGKNWPVGDPAGVKVIENGTYDNTMSHSRPAHCIMTTSYLEGAYLDAATPSETLCSSDFQTHKRFKLNMLPTMVGLNDDYGTGVNLTFKVAATGAGEDWRYMVLQKINNYTGKRLSGFKVEVGFVDPGTGIFTLAGVGEEVKLSIGTLEDAGGTANIWEVDELATFSHGLFGPQTFEEPVPHFATDGFFDNTGAGFTVGLNVGEDTIESTGAFVGSNYAALPVPNGAPITSQFGDWLPSIWAPKGIFWDDDNDPTTDAQLVAFWGNTGDGTYNWMKGDRDNFAVATALELATWASSPVHEVGVIEDVLNLGLNYIVEIGDVTTFPLAAADTFTIRITPYASADQTIPGYIGNASTPLSSYVAEEGTLSITPAPTFVIGDTLTLVVADSGLNASAVLPVETVDINVTTSLGEYEVITLTEIGPDRGVFTATLSTVSGTAAGTNSDGSINVTAGTVVTANYLDADNGSTGSAVVSAITSVASVATSDGGSSFAVNDKVSLLFTIFGFLVIGGLIARRKLA